ncbi:hypothetical protein V5N11_001175 [Cardamine amara subsp. amara]|uniref:Uncharacterized protein n=1 Tax=Cardamine amara subsp. amara TaxID=228776 RepID=A0ABD0ZU47_CARAN
MTRSRRLDSPSFRMMVKGSADCYGSFRSDIYGDLEDVEEDCKQQNMSSGSLALVKKRRRLGLFGFRRRKALKGKTEFGRGSYVFPSSVDRESEYSRKEEEEDGEDKSFGYGDGDGISCSQSSRFCEVKITKISRTGSFFTLPTPPSSSSSKSHFWTNVYAGLKQVVPWKNKRTTV